MVDFRMFTKNYCFNFLPEKSIIHNVYYEIFEKLNIIWDYVGMMLLRNPFRGSSLKLF